MLFLIIKRILLGFITLFIVSLITFVGTEVLPGDACTTYLEREAYGAALEACYKRLGLDIPAYERYLSWAYNVIQGDFGYSLSGEMPINEVLGPRIKNSLVLASAAIIIGIPLALILGIITAVIVVTCLRKRRKEIFNEPIDIPLTPMPPIAPPKPPQDSKPVTIRKILGNDIKPPAEEYRQLKELDSRMNVLKFTTNIAKNFSGNKASNNKPEKKSMNRYRP